MGIIPLEYLPGETAESLGLTGRERYTVVIPEQLTPRMIVDIKVHLCLYIVFTDPFYCSKLFSAVWLLKIASLFKICNSIKFLLSSFFDTVTALSQ